MNETNKRDYGLKPLPIDSRDYSHTLNFGSINLGAVIIPDFITAVPLEIKNQDINYWSDFCASYAAAEVAENEDLVIFCPEWSFAYAKHLLFQAGNTTALSDFGLNLRDICDSALQKNNGGFLPRLNDPFKCDSVNRPVREFIVNLSNWPTNTLSLAQKYAKQAYYSVDGPYDTFDNFRSVMWQNIAERRSIITGCLWRASWSQSPNSIIPQVYEAQGSPHAFVFCGQKTINGVLHLVARLSDGINFGDNGFFYFPREVVNREFGAYGAFTFKDNAPASLTDPNGVSVSKISIFNPLWIFKVIRDFIS